MSPNRILIIECNRDNKEIENILLKQRYQAMTLLIESLIINNIINKIKPDIIVFNSEKVTDKIVQFIKHLNQLYACPTILFSEDPNIQNRSIKLSVRASSPTSLTAWKVKVAKALLILLQPVLKSSNS
ncbi:hypothetical protein [Methyloprofundus sp.]|uniref:hypothetical protein n=1 Tax=Methyloprofundus sp. TaxID=2020875 RepID=UPI003D09DA2A